MNAEIHKHRAILQGLALTLVLHSVITQALAQPNYVEVGTPPVSAATERGEVFDVATKTWFSFPYYNSGDPQQQWQHGSRFGEQPLGRR